MLEMKAVALALASFLSQLSGQSVVLMSDNKLTNWLSLISGIRAAQCLGLCLMASKITVWTERHLVCLSTRNISRRKNILADQVLPTEWSLLPKVIEGICSVFGRPHLHLFATRAKMKLPLYVPPVLDPQAWKQDAF